MALTPEERENAEAAFDAAREAQHAFWDLLTELENALGVDDIDGTRDLADTDIDTLMEAED